MRILFMSDLHLECGRVAFEPAAADIVVLAGDIAAGSDGLRWARLMWPATPIVYVMGNHEYYGGHLNRVLIESRRVAEELDIHLLDLDEVKIHGVRFVGATLWTDFALLGSERIESAMLAARQSLNDFRSIRTPLGWLSPEQTAVMHQVARAWLAERLRLGTPTVVVTHHAPDRRSVEGHSAEHVLSAAYASDCRDLLTGCSLWIHGHTHRSYDYTIGSTRVLCNPRGYPEASTGQVLNAAFDSMASVEI